MFRETVTVWHVEVVHEGYFGDWPLEKDYDWVLITAKGYPSRFKPAVFRTKADAEKFLEMNYSIIEGRCWKKAGYLGLKTSEAIAYVGGQFTEPTSIARIGKRGPGRTSLVKK